MLISLFEHSWLSKKIQKKLIGLLKNCKKMLNFLCLYIYWSMDSDDRILEYKLRILHNAECFSIYKPCM